jgi:hypothetical protein
MIPNISKEALEYVAKRKQRAIEAIDYWSKTEVGYGIDLLSMQRASATALAMESLNKDLSKHKEDTISTNFGARPENVLQIGRIGIGNMLLPELITFLQLDSTDDALWFIDRKYSNTVRDAVAGQKTYESKAFKASQNLVTAEVYNSGTAQTAFNGTVSTVLPAYKHTVRVYLNDALVASDAGTGVLYGDLLDDTKVNSFDYNFGEYFLNFKDAQYGKIEIEYNLVIEDRNNWTQLAHLTIGTRKERFNATPKSLGFSYSLLTEEVMESTLGVNIDEALIQSIGIEMSKSKDFYGARLINSVALSNPLGVLKFNAKFNELGEKGYASNAQRIGEYVGIVNGDMFDTLNRGNTKKILVGSRAEAFLHMVSGYEATTSTGQGMRKVGKLNGVDVYMVASSNLTPTMPKNRMICIGNDIENEPLDVAIAVGTYKNLATKLTYPEGQTEGNIFSVDDDMVLEKRFIRAIDIEGLPTL